MEYKKELWKDVVGYAGQYTVSSKGRLMSLKFGKQKLMQPTTTKFGHKEARFSLKGKATRMYLHRLVLETFVGEAPDGFEGSHVDGDPSNNDVSNLRWESASANQQRRNGHGTSNRGSGHGLSKLCVKDVLEIRLLLCEGVMQRDIAKIYGVDQSTIADIKRKKSWGWLND